MIPEGHAAEFFGFFSIFNKVGSFAGPICFGLVRDVTDSSRLAVLFLASFFIVGALTLLTVNVAEGRAQAVATSPK
jgi:UMF1 family MFS transporter